MSVRAGLRPPPEARCVAVRATASVSPSARAIAVASSRGSVVRAATHTTPPPTKTSANVPISSARQARSSLLSMNPPGRRQLRIHTRTPGGVNRSLGIGRGGMNAPPDSPCRPHAVSAIPPPDSLSFPTRDAGVRADGGTGTAPGAAADRGSAGRPGRLRRARAPSRPAARTGPASPRTTHRGQAARLPPSAVRRSPRRASRRAPRRRRPGDAGGTGADRVGGGRGGPTAGRPRVDWSLYVLEPSSP